MSDGAHPVATDRVPVIDLGAYGGAAFDLDGVLTRTATLHALAWKRLFDAFLAHRAAQAGASFGPFQIDDDYLRHVDGKPRHDGVRDFLASRGIVLPQGEPDDPPERETVHGLGNRKNGLFRELLVEKGVQVFAGSVAFLQRLRDSGLKTAVVSSSENTAAILAAAGLGGLFDVRVDGIETARLGLKGKPAPDTFLHAALALGIEPSRLFGVEDSLAGVEAIRAAGYGLVIGVDRTGQAMELASHGAGLVVNDLDAIGLRPANAGPPIPAGHAAIASPPGFLVDRGVQPSVDPQWSLTEEGFDLAREHEIESLLAIGNGHVGTRGSLAEGSPLSAPATFVAGVFDAESPHAQPGLAIVPDWTRLSTKVEGQPVSLQSGQNLGHRRTLDLRKAILFRDWRHQDTAGRITRIHGFRLASAADRRLLLQSVAILPENYSGVISVDATLDGAMVKRTTTGTTIALAAKSRVLGFEGRSPLAGSMSAPAQFHVEIGRTYRLDRIFAVHTSRDPGDAQLLAGEHAERAHAAGLDALVEEHLRAWERYWETCDVRIDGDDKAQRAVRFAIYHLLSAANPDDPRVSIGARALTGGAYQGHVFWDTEIFMLPFFTLTCPNAAKALLLYRHYTLPAARRRAARRGRRGAWYAWESADTGDDVTPSLVIQPKGELTRVLTGEQEQHVSADVAYAVWNYWRATGDEGFLLDAGAEILVETARFWGSRARLEEDGRYHIRGVIGPDEYHETVDDNAYTNAMARWNLESGERVARLVEERWPQRWLALCTRLGLDRDEPSQWRAVAAGLYTGLNEKTGLIEQFQGYFDLEDIDLASFRQRNAPMDVVLGRERLQRSQIIKQPDVVMLLHLFWHDMPPAVREANFRYYEARCAHGSSLSPAIHALIAARLGDMPLAMRYFRQAMDIDLADNMGNAAGGVHAGALGALWQAIVFGFGGVELADDGPRLQPHLPAHWRGLSMRLMWRGRSHALNAPAGDAIARPAAGVGR